MPCITDLRRTIRGRQETVGEALGREVELLRRLPADASDAAEHATPRVDAKSLATVRQNQYSLPSGSPGSGSQRGSAPARSCSCTTEVRSPGTSGCTEGSGSPHSWTITSSCWRSSRARSPVRSRSARNANAGPGHPPPMRGARACHADAASEPSHRPRRRRPHAAPVAGTIVRAGHRRRARVTRGVVHVMEPGLEARATVPLRCRLDSRPPTAVPVLLRGADD